jgi:hypothetical protein
MTNARSIQGIIILILAIFAAIWLGISIATDQAETILQVSAFSQHLNFYLSVSSFSSPMPPDLFT